MVAPPPGTTLDLPDGRWLDVDGPLHYLEWPGSGERTFVLVHGLGGSHLNWVRVAPGLAGHGRVIVLDLPGFGRSPLEGRRSAMQAGRHVLSEFVRRVAARPVVLAGNSMGGGYAMLVAAFVPDIVEALILTGSVFPWARGGWPSPLVVGGFALYRTPMLGDWLVRERFRRLDPETIVRWGFRMTAADPSSIPRDVVQAHVALMRERRHEADAAGAFVEAARSILSLGARPSMTARVIDAVACPVLVIHGEKDRLVPAAFARSAVLRHPGWTSRFLPDIGHVPQLEAPEAWLSIVSGWLPTLGR